MTPSVAVVLLIRYKPCQKHELRLAQAAEQSLLPRAQNLLMPWIIADGRGHLKLVRNLQRRGWAIATLEKAGPQSASADAPAACVMKLATSGEEDLKHQLTVVRRPLIIQGAMC